MIFCGKKKLPVRFYDDDSPFGHDHFTDCRIMDEKHLKMKKKMLIMQRYSILSGSRCKID